MTGSSHESQDAWPGDTPVFGDFWDRAAGLLAPPDQPDPPPGPEQVPGLAVAMRGLVGTVGRYLDDARIDVGVARGHPDAWNQALAQGRGAVRRAAADLDCQQCAAAWPQLKERSGAIRSDSLAGRLAAAVTSVAVARDLLHTHFTSGPDGLRAEHSDWAPVIASAPVNRALLAGLADHVAAVARQVQATHLSSDIVGDRALGPAGELWRHVRRAARHLESFGMAVQDAQWQAPVLEADIRLLKAIPLNSVPERTAPAASDPVPALCSGLATAERHTELARRLTPRSQLEQVLLDRGVKDPVLLERAAAADRLTRQVMAEADASQPGSPAATRAPSQAATRGLGLAQVRAGADQKADVTQVKADVMAELRSRPQPAQAATAQLEEETDTHAHSARRGAGVGEAGRAAHAAQARAGEPVRHAGFPARARAELSTWQPPSADVSPEYGAQA